MELLTLHSFPRAVAHFDGDAFFAAVEQSLHPALRGRPVVTGRERGIIACASYEAKARGVARGITLSEARVRCPDLVILPSDYESYSLFSKRMFDLARRYTPMVEEYSIDEGFADLTGLRRVFHASYEDIARRFQQDVRDELGLTVSVGLSLSKSLAKLASKHCKPAGFTVVPGNRIHLFLEKIPLEKVWGFGPNTVNLLQKHGLRTALDYVRRTEDWAGRLLGKIGRELWNELRGQLVYPIQTEEKSSYASISKCKTFSVPTRDRDQVYARLVRNVESAFIKLRRHQLRARGIQVALRFQDFTHEGVEARLQRPTSATAEIMPLVNGLFEQIYRPGAEYRATMVALTRLEADGARQMDLFEDRLRIEKLSRISGVMDAVNEQYGKHAVSLGASLFLAHRPPSDRDGLPWRKRDLLSGETFRQRLNVPRLELRV